jgi:membrane protease YdiL (CAAX protease family)
MLSAVITAFLQFGIVLALAGILYFAFARKKRSFREFTGLYAAPPRSILLGLLLGLAFALLILLVPGSAEALRSPGTVTGDAVREGVDAAVVIGLLATALIKTSLAEELLFRGVIGKQLIRRLGFRAGNAIQAALFGAAHLLLLFAPEVTVPFAVGMAVLTGLLGWLNGWLNERFGRGSILPGWAVHAAANLCSYLAVASAVA